MKGGLVVAETQEVVCGFGCGCDHDPANLCKKESGYIQGFEDEQPDTHVKMLERHIQQLENTLGIQAALLCGFAAILGPNSIAVSTDLFEAVSGQQVVVQPDLENHQLVFYAIAPTEAADVD